MSSTHATVVVTDGDEVVHSLAVGRVDDVGSHVKVLEIYEVSSGVAVWGLP